MTSSSSPSRPALKVIRWVARVMSVLIILVMLFFFVGEGLSGGNSAQSRPISAVDIIQLVLAGLELVGLGIAWKSELTGGSLTLTAFIITGIVNPRTVMFPLILVPVTAILFILCWWLSRERHQDEGRVTQSS